LKIDFRVNPFEILICFLPDDSIEVYEVTEASKRLYGLSLFAFYAISDGLFAIFSKSYTRIKSFFAPPEPSLQLTLPWVT